MAKSSIERLFEVTRPPSGRACLCSLQVRETLVAACTMVIWEEVKGVQEGGICSFSSTFSGLRPLIPACSGLSDPIH